MRGSFSRIERATERVETVVSFDAHSQTADGPHSVCSAAAPDRRNPDTFLSIAHTVAQHRVLCLSDLTMFCVGDGCTYDRPPKSLHVPLKWFSKVPTETEFRVDLLVLLIQNNHLCRGWKQDAQVIGNRSQGCAISQQPLGGRSVSFVPRSLSL